jgi:FtsK/SpoIIIE family
VSTQTRQDISSGGGLILNIARIAWRWRTEIGLLSLIWICYGLLSSKVGPGAADTLVLTALGVILGIPRTRRLLWRVLRRARMRRRFSVAIEGLGERTLAERPPWLSNIEELPAGLRFTLALRTGTHVGLFEHNAEALAVALGARTVRVARDLGHAGTVRLTAITRDPFGAELSPWPLRGAQAVDAWAPIPVGVDEDGMPVSVSLPERNLLLGGEPGSGKSAAMSLLVAAAALDPSVHLWLFDGKGVDFMPFWNCARRFIGMDVGDAIAALDDLRSVMEYRYKELAGNQKRKVERGDGFALQVVAIDELALFTSHPDRKLAGAFSERLRDLVARGRAAGICVLAATQKPSTDVVPSAIRDLFSFRWALRCATREASDTVLGTGWATNGFTASEIDPQQRGVGLLLHEGGIPIRLRSYWLDDKVLFELSGRAGRNRPHNPVDNGFPFEDPGGITL